MDPKKYFQQHLLNWHQTKNKRQMPWKGEKNVYFIWLSEIILQQTRVEQGMKYYERFIEQYPTVNHLAKAPLEEVYKLWEGLGYYTRCRNLHASAQYIAFELNGKFPDTYESILALKGVGPYTAAAISSFGFGLPYAVVDGNVFRVLSRFFGISEPTDSTSGKQLFQQLAQACLAESSAAAYNQAIMDFGATVCKPDLPICASCCLQKKCVAFQSKAVDQYPVKEKQIKQRKRWFQFYILAYKNKFAVRLRTAKDVWANLYEFPQVEYNSEKQWKQAPKKEVKDWLSNNQIQNSFVIHSVTKPIKQQLTHQTIYAQAILIQLKGTQQKNNAWEWKTKKQLSQLAFPKLLNDFLKGNLLELFDSIDTTVQQKT